MPQKHFISSAMACRRLRVSRRTLRDMERDGRLPAAERTNSRVLEWDAAAVDSLSAQRAAARVCLEREESPC